MTTSADKKLIVMLILVVLVCGCSASNKPIHDVSSLWLGLIDDTFQGSPRDFADIFQLLEKYREVDAEIARIWKTEGQHALLHHMNAVFGYKPLIISKELYF